MNAATAAMQCVAALAAPGTYRATKFLSEDFVVKVTRIHKKGRWERSRSFVLTVGKPNYAERQFLRKCKKAGEPIPVRRVQLKIKEGY